MTIKEAIFNGNYEEAVEFVRRGHKKEIKSTLEETFFFQNLYRHAAGMSLIEALADKGLVELNVYKFKTIKSSILGEIIRYLKNNATAGNIEKFKSILHKTENLDKVIGDSNLMSYAIEQNVSIEIIEAMIKAGCDVNFLNTAGGNYLHRTVMKPTSTNNMDGQSQEASYIRFFTDKGVDINAKNAAGQTPLLSLIASANRYNRDTLISLIECGADVNARAVDGTTALDLALMKQNIDLCNTLLEHGATVDNAIQDDNQQSTIYRFLASCSYAPSNTELALLELIMTSGFDPFQINKSAYGKNQTLLDLILDKSPDTLKLMLEYVVFDLNEPIQDGNTALHKVCAYNINYESDKAKDTYRKVKILITQGADASLKNNDGKTALELAALDEKKYMTVEYLQKQRPSDWCNF
ncbi:MAG: hypothetical protein P8163_00825 [Candidatus Thiodiazotropha sp.]